MFHRKVGVAEEGEEEEQGDLEHVLSVDKRVTGPRTAEDLKNMAVA